MFGLLRLSPFKTLFLIQCFQDKTYTNLCRKNSSFSLCVLKKSVFLQGEASSQDLIYRLSLMLH